MKEELVKADVDSIATYVVEDVEEAVYASLGMTENTGHKVYVWDNRAYVEGE